MQHAKQTDVVSDPAAEQGSLVCRNLKQASSEGFLWGGG